MNGASRYCASVNWFSLSRDMYKPCAIGVRLTASISSTAGSSSRYGNASTLRLRTASARRRQDLVGLLRRGVHGLLDGQRGILALDPAHDVEHVAEVLQVHRLERTPARDRRIVAPVLHLRDELGVVRVGHQ